AFAQQVRATLARVQDKYDSVWVDDHFVPWAAWQSNDTPYVECMTTIAMLAGEFPRLRFGSSVLCQSYRNPALTAKMAANLQWWTGGRFIFGIGAGWLEEEYRAYGYEFPRPAVRIAQLEESVEIVRRLWTEPKVTYNGKHYQVQDAYCEPKPDPQPPILIGGGGEQLTLRVVAKHADWWNIPGGNLANYAHKLDVLKGHCEAVGRDYDTILKTWAAESIALASTEAEARRISAASPFQNGPIVGTPEQVADALRQYVDVGVRYFFVRLVDFPHTEGIEQFAEEVMPLLN
ncbi:MAG: LLM class flavin-dependent oxidoreductase, partial [Litorilinea sp.]